MECGLNQQRTGNGHLSHVSILTELSSTVCAFVDGLCARHNDVPADSNRGRERLLVEHHV